MLPKVSVSEQLAAAFSAMPPTLPDAVVGMCDAVLMDVAGLCVAARNSDYVQAALRATREHGSCTLIGHAGGFNVTTAALCNGTAAHGEDYDETYEGGPVHAGAVIIPPCLRPPHTMAAGPEWPRRRVSATRNGSMRWGSPAAWPRGSSNTWQKVRGPSACIRGGRRR